MNQSPYHQRFSHRQEIIAELQAFGSIRRLAEDLKMPEQVVRYLVKLEGIGRADYTGRTRHSSAITLDDVTLMHMLRNDGMQIGDIAEKFEISRSYCGRILRGEKLKNLRKGML